jgi:23S rRNA-/tRNA-specific pseudouridylate synthase
MFRSAANTVCFSLRQNPWSSVPPNAWPPKGYSLKFPVNIRFFRSSPVSKDDTIRHDNNSPSPNESSIRLSKLLAQHGRNLALSRREAERLIEDGEVTVAGQSVTSPHFLVSWADAAKSIKVGGKLVQFSEKETDKTTKVWIVHKWSGEVVTKDDPEGRPSLLERLLRQGLGKRSMGSTGQQVHLKAIGRLDITSEGKCFNQKN